MTIWQLIFDFGSNKSFDFKIEKILKKVDETISAGKLVREFLLLDKDWKHKYGYFKFYLGRGLGTFNLFRYFLLIMGFGALITGVVLDWHPAVFALAGIGAFTILYAVGFIECKLKLIDIESEISSHVINPPMRRIEENTNRIKEMLENVGRGQPEQKA